MASRALLDHQLPFAFAVGPRRIGRRLVLSLGRRLRREAALRPVGGWTVRPDPPVLIFPPVSGSPRPDRGPTIVSFLGADFALSGPIDWAPSIPTRSRTLWLRNLHSMEYLARLGDREFARIVRDWIGEVGKATLGRFPEAFDPYTVSIRTTVWLRALTRRRGRLPGDLVDAMHESLAAQLQLLARNLETHIGGNRLIKNLKALLWGAAYFGGRLADRWFHTALELLELEMPRQLLADGLHFERSISHHCQVFEDLIEVRRLLGPSNRIRRLDDWLLKAGQAIADLSHPDGKVSLFGDSGLSMALSPEQCLDAFEGEFGRRPWPLPAFCYPQGGYFGGRLGDLYLVADCGGICPRELPAHGHGDLLSYELSAGQQRLVVDQGVFEYVEGPRRDWARSCRSHNVLSIDGGDQARFFGSFRSVAQSRPELLDFRADGTALTFEGRHSGFAMAGGRRRPRHRRRLRLSAGKLDVRDMVERRGWEGEAASSLLLAPGARIERLDAFAILISYKGLRCKLTASVPVQVEPAVWWPDMGVEQATQRVSMTIPAGRDQLGYSIEVVPSSAAERKSNGRSKRRSSRGDKQGTFPEWFG